MEKKWRVIPWLIPALIGLVITAFGIYGLIRSIIKDYGLFGNFIIIFLGLAFLLPSLWNINKRWNWDKIPEEERVSFTERQVRFAGMMQSGIATFFLFFLLLKQGRIGMIIFLAFVLILLIPAKFKKAGWIPPLSLILVSAVYLFVLEGQLANSGLGGIAIITFMFFFLIVIAFAIPSLIKRIHES